jgi:hypothetical protein
VGTPFTYTVQYVGTEPVTVGATGLPAGLVLSGATISGVTTATPGQYTVSLTVAGPGGNSGQDLMLRVDSASFGDTDDDGFPDELEYALGTDPTNPASTPFGGAPAGYRVAFVIKYAHIKLNFATPGRDRITFRGRFPVPEGLTAGGQAMVLDVGGLISKVALDGKGRAEFPAGNGTGRVRLRFGKSTVAGQQLAKITANYSKGSFADKFVDEGLRNEDIPFAIKRMNFIILLNKTMIQTGRVMWYKAKAGKFGETRDLGRQ